MIRRSLAIIAALAAFLILLLAVGSEGPAVLALLAVAVGLGAFLIWPAPRHHGANGTSKWAAVRKFAASLLGLLFLLGVASSYVSVSHAPFDAGIVAPFEVPFEVPSAPSFEPSFDAAMPDDSVVENAAPTTAPPDGQPSLAPNPPPRRSRSRTIQKKAPIDPSSGVQQDCSGLGIIGSTHTCETVLRALQSLRSANAFIAAPHEVELEESFRLQVTVDPSGKITSKTIEDQVPAALVAQRVVPIASRMKAEIESEPAFEAKPLFSDAVRPVLPDRPTTWVWSLHAKKATRDINPIYVRLFALVEVDGKTSEPVELEVLSHRVNIKVSRLQTLSRAIAEVEPIYKFLVLLVTGIAGVIGWFISKKAVRGDA